MDANSKCFILRYSLDYGIFRTGSSVRTIIAESHAQAIRQLREIGESKLKRYFARDSFTPYVYGVDIYDCEEVSRKQPNLYGVDSAEN